MVLLLVGFPGSVYAEVISLSCNCKLEEHGNIREAMEINNDGVKQKPCKHSLSVVLDTDNETIEGRSKDSITEVTDRFYLSIDESEKLQVGQFLDRYTGEYRHQVIMDFITLESGERIGMLSTTFYYDCKKTDKLF